MEIRKSGMISIVGRPNVGKSTLTNALVGEKIAIVTNKPQTTRNRICAVVNREGCQFVFLDTPGLHKARTRLGDYMVKVVKESVADVDAVLLLVEPIPHIGGPEAELIRRIKELNVPAVLVINKIDTVEKEELLSVMQVYGAAHDFAAIVPISAKRNEGVDELLGLLRESGFSVTQATVSRDIKELRLLKVLTPSGKYKYATGDQADNNLTDRFIRMLAESLLSVSSANNLIVVKTLSGSANVAAEALDSMHWPEVLGTLAGDNTVLLIIRSNEETITVTSRIREMMK